MRSDTMATHFKHYINGRWETGVTLGVSENPSDLADVVGEFARADAAQAESAIRAAADAREAWAHSTPQRRAEVLELGALLAREEGKTLPEASARPRAPADLQVLRRRGACAWPARALASVRPGIGSRSRASRWA
jgi:delta 1-pyrroline-5-carboxylate dehydrogenase